MIGPQVDRVAQPSGPSTRPRSSRGIPRSQPPGAMPVVRSERWPTIRVALLGIFSVERYRDVQEGIVFVISQRLLSAKLRHTHHRLAHTSVASLHISQPLGHFSIPSSAASRCRGPLHPFRSIPHRVLQNRSNSVTKVSLTFGPVPETGRCLPHHRVSGRGYLFRYHGERVHP